MSCKVFSLEIISTFLHYIYINWTSRWTVLSFLIAFSISLVAGQVFITCGSELAAPLLLSQIFCSQDYFPLKNHAAEKKTKHTTASQITKICWTCNFSCFGLLGTVIWCLFWHSCQRLGHKQLAGNNLFFFFFFPSLHAGRSAQNIQFSKDGPLFCLLFFIFVNDSNWYVMR